MVLRRSGPPHPTSFPPFRPQSGKGAYLGFANFKFDEEDDQAVRAGAWAQAHGRRRMDAWAPLCG